jgi:hypothetical protein
MGPRTRRSALEIAAGVTLTSLSLGALPFASSCARRPDSDRRPEATDPGDGGPARAPASADDEPMAAAADPVASYSLRATVDDAKHTVDGEGKILWRNTSRVPQREIWLHLYLNGFRSERTVFMRFAGTSGFRGAGTPTAWGGITIRRLALGGVDLWPSADQATPGEPDDATDIRVPLPEAVPPGGSIELDVAFASQLPSLLFRTGYIVDEAGKSFDMVAQWFPKLARLEPNGHWAHFAFHHLSEFYADFGAYDVTVDTAADVLVGATGKQVSEERLGDRIARRFVQESVHDFAFTAWSRFRERTATGPGGVAVRVLFPPGYEEAADVELARVAFGLDHFGRAYGAYPYATLTVVHPPAQAEEAGGMEYPTLITTGGNWFLPWTGVHVIDLVTIHELGHQWFYGLVATNEHDDPFLDEGLNSYAEIDAMETLAPGRSAGALPGLAIAMPAVYRVGASDAERNAPVAQPAPDFVTGRDYANLVYQRTATILGTLANVYGADHVRAAVGRYARRYRFAHPTPTDFVAVMREALGDDAAEQLRAALFDRATVDYAVAEVDPSADPRLGGATGSVLVRRRGALRFPVDVAMFGQDGSVERARWDGQGDARRLAYHGASPLVAAVVDPEHRVLLDDDLDNNALRTSPARLSAVLVDRISFAAGALFSGILP